MAKVRIPSIAAKNGTPNYTVWIKLLNDIQSVNFTKDLNTLKAGIRDTNPDGDLELKVKELTELVDKKSEEVDITLSKDKANLARLNTLVKTIIAKFAKDAEAIANLNKQLTSQLNGSEGSGAKAKGLRAMLTKIKELTKIHNDMLAVPLLTLKALTTLTKVK